MNVGARLRGLTASLASLLASASTSAAPAAPTLELAETVTQAKVIETVAVDGAELAFAALSSHPVGAGEHTLSFQVSGPGHVQLAPCAGKSQPTPKVDGKAVRAAQTPAGQRFEVGPGEHRVELLLKVSGYEQRIACGAAPKIGAVARAADGLRVLRYASARAGARCGRCRPGQALVYVPQVVAAAKTPAPLLVGLHPWNGAIETYAAYAELLEAAEREGVVLLLADGLGNSLYTAAAEVEVLAALDALALVLPIAQDRISIFGASMGGAGATTVAYHAPDRFAGVTSLFGDSKYDLSSCVRGILRDEAGARQVNALDVIENARHLRTVLVHGDRDQSSKIEQSEWLAKALGDRGFFVRFDRKPGRGHEGRLVSELAADIVARAARERAASRPSRVSYRSVRASDRGAYGVSFDKRQAEAFVDLERQGDVVLVHACSGVRALSFAPDAFGAKAPLEVRFAAGVTAVPVTWRPAP